MEIVQGLRKIIDPYWRSHKMKSQLKKLEILKDFDLDENTNSTTEMGKTKTVPRKGSSVVFLVPGMSSGSGGHTSILRLGTYLSKFGMQVFYATIQSDDKNQMKTKAEENLSNYHGEMLTYTEVKSKEFDIGMATSWITAYFLWQLKHIPYKAYFIQDYEADFYTAGDIQTYVENTYRLGFHMISLGTWNKKRIEAEIDKKVDSVIFPFEPKEYSFKKNWQDKFVKKDKIKICAYNKGASKRGSSLLFLGLDKLYSELDKLGLRLEISIFGDDARLNYPLDAPYKNLGKLGKEELLKLYQDSDFGVVFSFTNISLVPLEMIAAGCNVVEAKRGTYKHFFSKDTAILVDSYPEDFAKKIVRYVKRPKERLEMAKRAKKELEGRAWKKASKQFYELLVS